MRGKELYERISTIAGHFDDLGTAIGRGVDAYNKVIGSMELRVLPTVRKFKELGVTGSEDIPALEQIDRKPRNIGILRELTEALTRYACVFYKLVQREGVDKYKQIIQFVNKFYFEMDNKYYSELEGKPDDMKKLALYLNEIKI